jgi:hypothetical protein
MTSPKPEMRESKEASLGSSSSLLTKNACEGRLKWIVIPFVSSAIEGRCLHLLKSSFDLPLFGVMIN